MTTHADLVITNATVITMNANEPRAGAVAVAGGRIVAVGSGDEMDRWMGPATDVIDLRGGVLSPGFVEPHSHLLAMALLLAPEIIDIRSFVVPTWPDIAARAQEAVSATPPGTPIVLFGLDPLVHDVPMPDRHQLDEWTTEHPLAIVSLSAHSVSGNTAAWAYAGIDAETADPVGGRFGHEEDGSLTGRAHEAPAVVALLRPLLAGAGVNPARSVHGQAATLARAGFTTIGELMVQPQDFPVLDVIRQTENFPLRMRLYEMTAPDLNVRFRADGTDPRIRETGFKLWVDGTPLEGTSLHYEPFLDTEATRRIGLVAPCCGSANYTEEQLLATCRAYAAAGLQAAAHVQGDAAIDRILDVYETVLNEGDLVGSDHRWRLEHCGEMSREQFQRAAGLGVTCSMFVQHLYYFGDLLVDDILGPPQGEVWMPLRTATDAGIRISLHHDGYFTPPNPLGSVQTAVTRRVKSGRALGADECISVDEAMKAVTINAAWHLFSEHEVGSIEVGKFADFAELSADPYAVDPSRLAEQVRVVGTWLNGRRIEPDERQV